ncbi:MAG: hypothetical protein LBE59_06995 [Nevskiaceae bacterium]|jgi:hypothetical protein|nr:hypothetical protein [Nevskiaceae bacterium]
MNIMRCAACALLVISLQAGAAEGNVPRMPNGKPDFNGTWENGGGIDFVRPETRPDGSLCISGCAPPPPPGTLAPGRLPPDRPKYKPEFQAQVKDLTARQQRTDPVLRCQPPGVPRIGPPDKIIQTAREAVFLYEDVSGPFFRIVPLTPGVKRIDDSQSYLGDAQGRWDGDVLVVETGNFNDLSWLTDDGSFHTTDLKVTERLTRTPEGIFYEATADDPAVLAEPWVLRPRVLTVAEAEMSEPAPCADQDLAHMQDDSYHSNPR